jgi:hypothetical protein
LDFLKSSYRYDVEISWVFLGCNDDHYLMTRNEGRGCWVISVEVV